MPRTSNLRVAVVHKRVHVTTHRPTGGIIARATFELDGSFVRGDDMGLTPNDVRYLAWRQKCSPVWTDERCEREWVGLGNPPPWEGT